MPIGISGPAGKDMKRPTLGSRGQHRRSHEAEDRFGVLAEASFSIPLCRVGFLALDGSDQ